MRVLCVTQDFLPNPGGTAVFMHNLCDQLCRLGHQVDILTPTHEGDAEADTKQPYRVYRYLSLRRLSSIVPIHRTLVLYRRRHYDVIFIGHFMTTYALGAVLLSRLFRVPYVILVHGYDLVGYFHMSRVDNIVARLVLRNASWVFANSNYTRERAIALDYDAAKLTVVNPGVDVDRFQPNIEASEIRRQYGLDGKKVILTVSRLVERKGHADVLRALPQSVRRLFEPQSLPEPGRVILLPFRDGIYPQIR